MCCDKADDFKVYSGQKGNNAAAEQAKDKATFVCWQPEIPENDDGENDQEGISEEINYEEPRTYCKILDLSWPVKSEGTYTLVRRGC